MTQTQKDGYLEKLIKLSQPCVYNENYSILKYMYNELVILKQDKLGDINFSLFSKSDVSF